VFYKRLAAGNTCKAGGYHSFQDEHTLSEALDAYGHANWVESLQLGTDQEGYWAYCTKCHGLYRWSEFGGKCFDGANHNRGGSGNYILTTSYGSATPGAYFQCQNCFGLYTELASGTHCNVGGAHTSFGSDHHFVLSSMTVQVPVTGRTYPVHPGDNLDHIATIYGTTAQKIFDVNKSKYTSPNWKGNPMTLGHIETGWVLNIPD
jgi:hypothetical protein